MPRKPNWTYMLRIPQGNPNKLRMDRLADYMREFAELLGVDNQPVFTGIKNASIGLRSKVPESRRDQAWKRLQEAKYKPTSRAAGYLKRIETMLGEDGFGSAELKDNHDNVVYLFHAIEPVQVQAATIKQLGEVDGVVTGLVGADDTMHLYLRDMQSRDLRLIVRDESLARELLLHFRKGMLRVRVHGYWLRTEDGWSPESGKSYVDGFEILDETPPSVIMARLASFPGNGWRELPDPEAEWKSLRGVN